MLKFIIKMIIINIQISIHKIQNCGFRNGHKDIVYSRRIVQISLYILRCVQL